MILFNILFKLVSRFNALVWNGFLGAMPDDLISKIYTNILKLSGSKIGKNSLVHHRVHVWYPENIDIGCGTDIPASVDMAGMDKITIGDNSRIGASVRFITNHHPYNENVSEEEKRKGSQKPITLENNVFVMNNVLLVAGKNGITIGEYSWIASGAVVVTDVEPYSLYAGVPAKKVKEIIYRK